MAHKFSGHGRQRDNTPDSKALQEKATIARLPPDQRSIAKTWVVEVYTAANDEMVSAFEREHAGLTGESYKTGWMHYVCAERHTWWDKRPLQKTVCPTCPQPVNSKRRGPGSLLAHDLTDRPFGKLTARRHLGNGEWMCECACGGEKQAASANLRAGKITTCGNCKKDKKRPDGYAVIQISAEAKSQLDRARAVEQRPLIDLASEAIEAVWGNLQQ